MSKQKKSWDPYRRQRRVMAVIAVVLCISLVLSLVAGLLAYNGAPGMLGLPLGIVLMIGFLLVMKKRQTA